MPLSDITRRSFLKFLGYAVAGGWLSACAPEMADSLAQAVGVSPDGATPKNPAATAQPSQTTAPTPINPSYEPASPTQTPLPTSTATQRYQPTAVPSQTPEPTFTGEILTRAQTERLASGAHKYIAESEEDAIQVARSLGYLVNDGHPASVCGPLSAAILRDAGLISPYVDLHEFWLLNPRQNLPVLERSFPKDAFLWYQTDQPITTFDFKSFPLKAGDFIYLFAGDPGSFEHMLTVSYVDEQGRPYAVTNYNTPEGYIIQEVLLVDPDQPGAGQFAYWTNRKNGMLGLTGFGGFLLIRFNTPIHDRTLQEQQFAQAVDDLLLETGGVWRIMIKKVGGDLVYARDERRTLHPASVIKVPIAMLFFKSLERFGIDDYDQFINKGKDGRSYKQLLTALLVKSEEAAAETLERAILENRLDIQATLQAWGVEHTYLDVRQSTAHDIITLFEGLYHGDLIPPVPRQIILENMAAYTPGDDLRLGTIRRHLPVGYPFYNKRGTITDGFMVVGDAAVVRIPLRDEDADFILAAFGYQGNQPVTFATLETAIGKIAELFWQFTQSI